MQNKMASLWKPGRGVYVKELSHNHYIFQFYHEVDIERVIEGSPWTLDHAPLIFVRVKHGENPRLLALEKLDLWVQIHDMTSKFMSEKVIKDVGNYIGSFVKSDPNNFQGVWRNYFRIRVSLRVDLPLHRNMKLEMRSGASCTVNFKYEDLPTFCFICRILGHSERFCDRLFDTPMHLIEKLYNLDLKAPPRRRHHNIGVEWLRTGPVANSGSSTSQTSHQRSDTGGRQSESVQAHNQGSGINIPKFRSFSAGVLGGHNVQGISGGNGGDFERLKGALNVPSIYSDSFQLADSKKRKTALLEGPLGPIGSISKESISIGPSEIENNVVVNNERNQSNVLDPPVIMNALSWNCQGFWNQRAFQFLKEIVSHKKPNFVFLCETKCNKSRVEWVGNQLVFEGIFVVQAQGFSGGLALLWKNKDEEFLLGFSSNHIDLSITIDCISSWRLTGLCGEPNRGRRQHTWELFRELARRYDSPWCIIGDVNNVMSQQDKKGGRPYPRWLLEGFQSCVSDCGLVNLDVVGYQYTWEKCRGTSSWVEARLDRALVSNSWLQLFPGAILSNLEYSYSDHSPIYLEPIIRSNHIPYHLFRFENAWLKEPMCIQIVKDSWEAHGEESIMGKINLCATNLSRWGKDLTGNFKRRIQQCKNELSVLKNKRDAQSVSRYEEVKVLLANVLDQRETFWRQRSKQLWLKDGDRNSKYFHLMASKRKRHNMISKLKNEQGVYTDWDHSLAEVIVNYFNNLFSASSVSFTEVIGCVNRMVSDSSNEDLLQPIVEEEVRKAIFKMHPDKSLVFITGEFEMGCGDANVVLIPKNKKPASMKDLRPISLCNLLYKVITKVMANHMKPLMDGIISASQSAFIPGRLISDNVMASFEVLHYLKRKRARKTGFMALKLDMSKAYDRIEWQFLEAILQKIGFSSPWLNLVMKCVSSAKYTIVDGPHEIGLLLPSRGICQGDPLLPYLFILCAEGLSALLQKYEHSGWIHGCKVANGAPRVSHMLFADDNYLYCKATVTEAVHIQNILHSFELASGQQVNLAKSLIFFSTNTDSMMEQQLCTLLQMQEAAEVLKDLWVPNETNPWVVSTHPGLVDVTVANVLTMDGSGWDLEIIADLFEARDQSLIREDESVLHCLVTCRVVKLCWNQVGIDTMVTPEFGFLDWCWGVFQQATSDQLCLMATICWAVWGARNDLVWNGKDVIPDNIVYFAKKYLDKWKNARQLDSDTSYSAFQAGDGNEHWCPPQTDSIKINVDAALFERNQSYGFGLVARDSNGLLIEGRTTLVYGVVEPVLTEVLGIKETLSWIKEAQWQNVTLESDCLCAVQAIRSSLDMFSTFGLIVKDCKILLASLTNVSISFVKRIANLVAHNFANAAILFPDRRFNLEHKPTDLLPYLVVEVHG
uniref:Reverse transcriptase domain-containing protein n=1 Tax=Cannabis sativa TaxID=3483 RepID=A0A803QQI1_CANSA